MTVVSKAGSVPSKADPAHDVLRSVGHPLDAIFQPQSVAVIGASERQGSVGRSVLWNLLSSPFGGTVFPVNPKRSNMLGVRAYKSIAELPEGPDLVVVTTPADTVPGLIQEAVDAGVPAGIVISAGFKEFGEHGKELEHEISRIIQGKMRLIGPNCLGVMNPIQRLERDVRPHHCAAGQRGLHQPERRALHRGAGLELAGEWSASAPSSRSARCSTWTGAT